MPSDDPDFFFQQAYREDAEREEFLRQQHAQTGNGTPQPDGKDHRHFVPVRFRNVLFTTATRDLISGLIPTDALVVVWGAPKCGKSFLVYDMGMHIARGATYRGRRVLQGTVVYVACEGARGLKARTEAYRQTLPPDADPPFYLLTTKLDLVAQVKTLIADIRATLDSESCVVIVLDTLNRSLCGSENDPEDMTAYIKAADELRDAFPRSTVVLIHHCGIEGKRPRGFTGLAGAADAQIAVNRDAVKNVIATVEFMKDGDDDTVIVSKLRVVIIGHDEYGTPLTSCIVEPADTGNPTPPQKAQIKLTPKQQIALDALRRAIAAHGKPAPTHNYIPTHATVVSVDLWRRFYLAGTSVNEQKEDTRRHAWRDASERLQAKHIIDIRDEMVWEI